MIQKLSTTAELAQKIGCCPMSVRRAALRLGLSKIGVQFLFSKEQAAEISRVVRKKSGNPNFVSRKGLR